jgi:hypothetical protein
MLFVLDSSTQGSNESYRGGGGAPHFTFVDKVGQGELWIGRGLR